MRDKFVDNPFKGSEALLKARSHKYKRKIGSGKNARYVYDEPGKHPGGAESDLKIHKRVPLTGDADETTHVELFESPRGFGVKFDEEGMGAGQMPIKFFSNKPAAEKYMDTLVEKPKEKDGDK